MNSFNATVIVNGGFSTPEDRVQLQKSVYKAIVKLNINNFEVSIFMTKMLDKSTNTVF